MPSQTADTQPIFLRKSSDLKKKKKSPNFILFPIFAWILVKLPIRVESKDYLDVDWNCAACEKQ